jgi:hypothetical protein
MINISKATLYAAGPEHHNPFHPTSIYGGPLNLYITASTQEPLSLRLSNWLLGPDFKSPK